MYWIVPIFLLFSGPAWAEKSIFREEYEAKKYAIMADVERCEIIGARDISALQYMPIPVLLDDMKNIESLFQNTQQKRGVCYEKALSKFNKLLTNAMAYNQAGSAQNLRQYELDESVASMLHLRRTVALMLLDSTLADIKLATAEFNALSDKQKEEKASLFFQESLRTRNLVKEEMALVMEMDRRQLAQDELRLILEENPSPQRFTRIKLAAAHHFFTQATLVFEDAYTQPKLLLLARLNTDFSTGAAKLAEITAFAPNLGEVLNSQFNKIAQQARNTQREVEATYTDMAQDIYGGDFEEEIQNLYTDISNINAEIRSLLKELQPKAQSTEEFATSMQESLNNAQELLKETGPTGEEKPIAPLPEDGETTPHPIKTEILPEVEEIKVPTAVELPATP